MLVLPIASRERLRLSRAFWILPYLLALIVPQQALSQGTADKPCFRPATGSIVSNPPELRSHNGLLEVDLSFNFRPTVMGEGPYRYCYVADSGMQAPTLRVRPGDRLIIHFRNEAQRVRMQNGALQKRDCSDRQMGPYTTNLHFHGLTVPPTCHQDDVLHTMVLEIDGQRPNHARELDTINIPHWSGEGPYPSVKLRMDFRDPNIIGIFPYRCHIEKHADMGMMGTIQVLPPAIQSSFASANAH